MLGPVPNQGPSPSCVIRGTGGEQVQVHQQLSARVALSQFRARDVIHCYQVGEPVRTRGYTGVYGDNYTDKEKVQSLATLWRLT